MRRRGLALGTALVAAAAALALAAGGAEALHDQGADDGDPYLFHEKYVVGGPKTDQQSFLVEAPDGEDAGETLFCYLRSFRPGLAGMWSSTVYDAFNQPWIQENGVWSDRSPQRSVHVVTPLYLLHPGEFGMWTLQVRAGGLSPEVHVYMEWVASVDECDHPPDDV